MQCQCQFWAFRAFFSDTLIFCWSSLQSFRLASQRPLSLSNTDKILLLECSDYRYLHKNPYWLILCFLRETPHREVKRAISCQKSRRGMQIHNSPLFLSVSLNSIKQLKLIIGYPDRFTGVTEQSPILTSS